MYIVFTQNACMLVIQQDLSLRRWKSRPATLKALLSYKTQAWKFIFHTVSSAMVVSSKLSQTTPAAPAPVCRHECNHCLLCSSYKSVSLRQSIHCTKLWSSGESHLKDSGKTWEESDGKLIQFFSPKRQIGFPHAHANGTLEYALLQYVRCMREYKI